MFKLLYFVFLFIFLESFFFHNYSFGQSSNLRLSFFEEYVRRTQVSSDSLKQNSFLLRPLSFFDIDSLYHFNVVSKNLFYQKKKALFLFPMILSTQNSFGNPYPENSPFVVSKGFQTYASLGFRLKLGQLSIQFVPEYIYIQNLPYDFGLTKSFSTEYLEDYGDGKFEKLFLGQSNVKFNFGAFSAGFSNENVWWGPGQFNSLLFSYNAFGFNHLTINTRRPAKTFLGSFEGQVLVGKLEGANFLFKKRDFKDSRYLNGFTLSFNPIGIPNLYIGFSRVFQLYLSSVGSGFSSYFPIFEDFQKIRLGNNLNGQFNSSDYDNLGQSQQLTGSFRYLVHSANAELYFEYGRRDHALNWREAFLNPEHARAYLFGFSKVLEYDGNKGFQIRGEVLQQQESINLLVRGADLRDVGDRSNWGGHYPISQGFTHLGQMLGPGVGPSSNVQTLEVSWFEGFRKLGLRFERVNRYQDRYNKLFFGLSEHKRWVDLSARAFLDLEFGNFVFSSNVNLVNSLNYQWKLNSNSSLEFPSGKNLFSIHSNLSIIYFLNER
jgi:hypothetical protein